MCLKLVDSTNYVENSVPLFEDLITLKLLTNLNVLATYSSMRNFYPHHRGTMPSGKNYSNYPLNTGVSAPRYDNRCKIQVIIKNRVFGQTLIM